MQSLNCHLPKMLLYTEICEFIICDDVIRVLIVSEDIPQHVRDFILILVKNRPKSFSDLFLFKLLIVISIERDEYFIHFLTDSP